MPLIRLQTNEDIAAEQSGALLADLTRIVAEGIGKPQSSVMAVIQSAEMMMAGAEGSSALVEVKSIGGLSQEVNQSLTERICAVLQDGLDISPERVYVNFVDVERSNWGWNSKTFA